MVLYSTKYHLIIRWLHLKKYQKLLFKVDSEKSKAATYSSRADCSYLTNIKLFINCSITNLSTLLIHALMPDQYGGLLGKFLRNDWHRTVLGANVGTYLNGKLMSLLNTLALQNAGTESTGEAITCTYGISHLNLWSFLE